MLLLAQPLIDYFDRTYVSGALTTGTVEKTLVDALCCLALTIHVVAQHLIKLATATLKHGG